MTRLVELGPAKFIRFLSDLWTQRDWQTNVQPRGEGRYLVQGQRGDGMKGFILMLPTVETAVEIEHIRGLVAYAKERGVDTVVVATQGKFADAVRESATNHDVTLSDRDELGETIADEGLEQVVKQYTDDGVFETAEVEFGLPFDLSEPVGDVLASLPIAVVHEQLTGLTNDRGDTSGGDDDNGGNSDDGGDGGSSAGSLRDKLPSSVDNLKSGSSPSVRVIVVVVLLLVLALGPVAVLGPMLDGLGGSSGGGSEGDYDVFVFVLLSASTDSAGVVARWSAQAADIPRVGGQAYVPSEGEQFVAVGFNVTATGDSPGSLSQLALVLESNGVRYGHQPLPNATGFDNGGLFAPGDDVHVWTVLTTPANATTGTVLIRPINESTAVFAHDDTVSADPNGDD